MNTAGLKKCFGCFKVCLDDAQNGSWSDMPSWLGLHASVLSSKMSCRYSGVLASMETARVPVVGAFDLQIWLALLPTVLKSRTQVSSALITLARLTSCCFSVHATLCLKLDCQNLFVSSECSCWVTPVPAVFDQKSIHEKCTDNSFVNGSNQTTHLQQ